MTEDRAALVGRIDWTGGPPQSMVTVPAGGLVSFKLPEPATRLTINGLDGRPMVSVLRDGSIEFGENYDPDDAARTFWQCIGGWPSKDHAAQLATLRDEIADTEQEVSVLERQRNAAERREKAAIERAEAALGLLRRWMDDEGAAYYAGTDLLEETQRALTGETPCRAGGAEVRGIDAMGGEVGGER